ncbi:MAG: hypothetical protein OXI95_01895 [bacterium]|nr:hypothetical protein [bacterium]
MSPLIAAALALGLSAGVAVASDMEDVAIPVLVVGNEEAVNPHLIRRDSPLFRETAFVNLEQALAQYGFRAMGEEAFEGAFDLDSGGEGPWGRWLDEDFLSGAMHLSADEAGTCIPFLITVRVYVRIWHDRPQFLRVDPDISIYDVQSGTSIGGTAPVVEVALPAQCPPTGCLESVFRASASDIFRALGEEVARQLSEYRTRHAPETAERHCM